MVNDILINTETKRNKAPYTEYLWHTHKKPMQFFFSTYLQYTDGMYTMLLEAQITKYFPILRFSSSAFTCPFFFYQFMGEWAEYIQIFTRTTIH